MNYTFEQAKHAVAERHNWESWDKIVNRYLDAPEEFSLRWINEACEGVAKLMCNEAVKADREFIKQNVYTWFATVTAIEEIRKLPLPFPEQS